MDGRQFPVRRMIHFAMGGKCLRSTKHNDAIPIRSRYFFLNLPYLGKTRVLRADKSSCLENKKRHRGPISRPEAGYHRNQRALVITGRDLAPIDAERVCLTLSPQHALEARLPTRIPDAVECSVQCCD